MTTRSVATRIERATPVSEYALPTIDGTCRPLDVTFFQPWPDRDVPGKSMPGSRGDAETLTSFRQLAGRLLAALEVPIPWHEYDEQEAEKAKRSCVAEHKARGQEPDAAALDHAALVARLDSAKKRLLGFAPAAFKDNHRAKANVTHVSAYAGDFDEMTAEQWQAACDKLEDSGVAFFAYGSPKDGIPKKLAEPSVCVKRRLLIALSRDVTVAEAEKLQRLMPAVLSLKGDGQTFEASRLFFVGTIGEPGCASEGADTENALDVDAVLRFKLPGSEKPQKTTPKPTANETTGQRAAALTRSAGHTVALCPANTAERYGEQLCKSMAEAIEGKGGSSALLRVARALRWGLKLDDETCAALIAEHYNPRCVPAWSGTEIAHKVAEAGKREGAPYTEGFLLSTPGTTSAGGPLIVQRDGRYWLRAIGGDDYEKPITQQDLRVRLKRYAGEVELRRKDDKLLSVDEICQQYSTVAMRLAADFASHATTWDEATETLTEGYRLPSIEAQHDPEVEAWLRAMVGEGGLTDLYGWIASTRQDRLRELAAVLVLVGPPGIGKTLIFLALARLWGCEKHVELKAAVAQFNGPIAKCPIWLDDECEALRDGLISSVAFRRMVQDRARDVEPKGKEKRALLGCARIGITANDVGSITFTDVDGSGAVDAIADRLAMYVVPRERRGAIVQALHALRLPGSDDVDLDRLARHFAQVQGTVQPRPGRFLGARTDNSSAIAAALAGVVKKHAALFDLVREYLLAGEEKDRGYDWTRRTTPAEWARCFPLLVRDGEVWAYPVALAGALDWRDVGRVHEALEPFRSGERKPVKVAGKTVRLWPLSIDSLWDGLGFPEGDRDAVTRTLATDTSARGAK